MSPNPQQAGGNSFTTRASNNLPNSAEAVWAPASWDERLGWRFDAPAWWVAWRIPGTKRIQVFQPDEQTCTRQIPLWEFASLVADSRWINKPYLRWMLAAFFLFASDPEGYRVMQFSVTRLIRFSLG